MDGPPKTVCEGGCLPFLARGPQCQAIIKTGGTHQIRVRLTSVLGG